MKISDLIRVDVVFTKRYSVPTFEEEIKQRLDFLASRQEDILLESGVVLDALALPLYRIPGETDKEFRDRLMCLIRGREAETHAGMIQNPITGEWSWL